MFFLYHILLTSVSEDSSYADMICHILDTENDAVPAGIYVVYKKFLKSPIPIIILFTINKTYQIFLMHEKNPISFNYLHEMIECYYSYLPERIGLCS